jgi:hypothetical protein
VRRINWSHPKRRIHFGFNGPWFMVRIELGHLLVAWEKKRSKR